MRALAAVVLLGGCFSPDLGDTPFRCGTGDACPPDYTCGSDDLCHKNGAADGSTTPPPDGANRTPDAPRPDAKTIALDAGATCKPGTFDRCQDVMTALICDASGMSLDAVTCEAGCDTSHMQCNHCQPGTTLCNGNNVVSCGSEGTVTSTHTCLAGCDQGVTPNACFLVAPTGFADACRQQASSDFTAAGSMTISTTDCSGGQTASQDVGPDLCIFKYANVTIPAGTSVRFTGARVPVIIATGTAQLNGQLFVNGRADTPGPGTSMMGAGTSAAGGAAGAGGGGHATAGAAGGSGAGGGTPPGGGPAFTAAQNKLLLPGGNGGQGLASAMGGGSGGAIGLIACGVLMIDAGAVIDAGGGGGPGGASGGAVGGAGGGAGGTIRIDAAQIMYLANARIVANGGGGGGGNGVSTSGSGTPGDDGHLDGTPASGSAAAAGGGSGGTGGTSDGVTGAAPGVGAAAGLPTAGGGGGGGAAGAILINTPTGVPKAIPTGVVVSPAPKLGDVVRGH